MTLAYSDTFAWSQRCHCKRKALYKTTHEPFSKGSYVIGSGEKMELTADIVNSGEDAFNAVLYLQIPRGINYISANTSNSQVRVACVQLI